MWPAFTSMHHLNFSAALCCFPQNRGICHLAPGRTCFNNTIAAEESQLTERLLIYRRKRAKMLYHGDHHLIEFPEGDIVAWDRKRKRSLLRTLDTCNRRYILDCETLENGQRVLTSYFQPILTTLDEDEDGSVSSGDEMDNDWRRRWRWIITTRQLPGAKGHCKSFACLEPLAMRSAALSRNRLTRRM